MLAPMVEPLLAELDRAIAAGESAQAFRDRVPALLGLMDPEALGSGLADAAFKANLTGAADLDLAGNESTPVNKG
jgi:phage gp29-like protein